MKRRRAPGHLFIACSVVATLAGCAAGATAPPPVPAEPLNGPASWMEPQGKSGDLLYISYYESQFIGVFTYPGLQPVGKIENIGETLGLCTDAAGHVFVGSGGEIREYRHGGTSPIVTLYDGERYAWACSVDPTTGNLAVVSTASPSANNGDVAIYKGARGSPKAYKNPLFQSYFGCGYDAFGNLYVMGFGKNSSGPNLFAVLPKGGSALKPITLSHTPEGQGDVQWDGKYVAVGSPNENEIIQFQIKGKIGKEVGSTNLDANAVEQFSFPTIFRSHGQVSLVIGASYSTGNLMIWNYPAGGNPIKTLYGNSGSALSAVVSIARRSP